MRTAPNKIELFLDEKVFIKKNFKSLTARQMLEHLNASRSQKLKLHTLRLKYYELGLYKEQKRPSWNERETRFLVNNYQKLGNMEICSRLNRYANRTRDFNVKSIWKKMKLMKLVRTKKQLDLIRKNHIENGIWKKSQLICASKRAYPEHKMIIRHTSDNRKYRYIKYGGKMVQYHRYVWALHHGDIPSGHKIYFKDGNTLNCNIENLICLSGRHMVYKREIAPFNDVFLGKDHASPSKYVPARLIAL